MLRDLNAKRARVENQDSLPGDLAVIKAKAPLAEVARYAAQLGSIFALRPTDWMVPSFRETAAMLWRGWPIEKLPLLYSGYLEGGQPDDPPNSGAGGHVTKRQVDRNVRHFGGHSVAKPGAHRDQLDAFAQRNAA